MKVEQNKPPQLESPPQGMFFLVMEYHGTPAGPGFRGPTQSPSQAWQGWGVGERRLSEIAWSVSKREGHRCRSHCWRRSKSMDVKAYTGQGGHTEWETHWEAEILHLGGTFLWLSTPFASFSSFAGCHSILPAPYLSLSLEKTPFVVG
jgi:hypothetical protein